MLRARFLPHAIEKLFEKKRQRETLSKVFLFFGGRRKKIETKNFLSFFLFATTCMFNSDFFFSLYSYKLAMSREFFHA